jgi:YD repeat-containing protein
VFDGPGEAGLGYVTSVQLAPAAGGTGMSYGMQYDCWLGQPTRFTDVNGIVTAYSYGPDADAKMDRLATIVKGSGSGTQHNTAFEYGTTLPAVFVKTKSSLQTATDANMQVETSYDGFGRATEVAQWNGSSWIRTKTEYDAANRVRKQSNPSSTGIYSNTIVHRDGLGRPERIELPDSASITSVFSGNATLTADPAGVRKVLVTDALGRLVQVIENPRALNEGEAVTSLAGNPGTSATITRYGYDGADRLVVVCPAGGTLSGSSCSGSSQARTFGYDLLGRLTSAVNPESSAITYKYDEAASTNGGGNLTSKEQTRGISTAVSATTRYHYDGLNRLTQMAYTGTPNGITTPNVTYTYDSHSSTIAGVTSYAKGRLTRIAVASGTETTFDSFDPLGPGDEIESDDRRPEVPVWKRHGGWIQLLGERCGGVDAVSERTAGVDELRQPEPAVDAGGDTRLGDDDILEVGDVLGSRAAEGGADERRSDERDARVQHKPAPVDECEGGELHGQCGSVQQSDFATGIELRIFSRGSSE